MNLIDTHVHLSDHKFDIDIEQTISRSKEKNISYMIEIGCEPDLWQKSLNIACANTNIFCGLGLHPQEAKHYSEQLFQKLETLCGHEKVKAIGETGLDYHFENSSRDTQEKVFKEHINLSLKLQKPLVIHCRKAYDDLIEILQDKIYLNKKFSGVIHCFSGTQKQAFTLIDMGFLIGIDGPVTYPNASELRNIVEQIPLENIVIETDCPYLPPQPYRGKRNEPSYIISTAQKIAELKKTSIENIAEITTLNAKKLFTL